MCPEDSEQKEVENQSAIFTKYLKKNLFLNNCNERTDSNCLDLSVKNDIL